MIKFYCNPNSYSYYVGYTKDETSFEEDILSRYTSAIVVAEDTKTTNTFISGNRLVDIPEAPSSYYIFNYITGGWEYGRDINEAKTLKWTEVKKARDQAEFGTFEWDGSVFDCDTISQQKIMGAVQLSQLISVYSETWTLANNTTRVLNQSDILQVGIALGQHLSNIHNISRDLRASIDACTTKEEVDAISVSFS